MHSRKQPASAHADIAKVMQQQLDSFEVVSTLRSSEITKLLQDQIDEFDSATEKRAAQVAAVLDQRIEELGDMALQRARETAAAMERTAALNIRPGGKDNRPDVRIR